MPILVFLMALWAAPVEPPARSAPEGEIATIAEPTIAQIVVDAPWGESVRALLALIDIRPGEPLVRASVQRAIERLYALGRFTQIEARIHEGPGGVMLRFELIPMTRLDVLTVRGVRGIPVDALVRSLRLAPGEEVDSSTQGRLKERALRWLNRMGYPEASASVESKPGSAPHTVALTVRVHQGQPIRVTSVRWRGTAQVARVFLAPELRTRVQSVLSRGALDEDRTRMLELLREHGFLRAEVPLPEVEVTGHSAQVTFTVHAHERVSFHTVGNHALADRTLANLWPASLGGPPEQMLGLFKQRIEARYLQQGYPDAEVHVRLQAGHAKTHRQVDVHVKEGAPVWIESLTFQGAHALPRGLLQEQVHTLLLSELSPINFFGRLSASEWILRGAPQAPQPRTAPQVPPACRYHPELYQQAADDIVAAYRDLGFLDVTVATPVLRRQSEEASHKSSTPDAPIPAATPPDPEPLFADGPVWPGAPAGRLAPAARPQIATASVAYAIEEGPQRFIDSIGFVGNRSIQSTVLLAAIAEASDNHALSAPIAPGAPLSESGVEDGRIAIIRTYRDQGFLYARVAAHTQLDARNTFAEVTYTIEEGPAVRVQEILVRGNTHTRERIIRSRMTLKKGSLYKLNQAIADQRETMALGVFQSVRVRLVDEEHPSDSKDMVTEVDESPRQLIEVVPGVSTTQGLRLKASYSHLNVLGTAGMFVASAKVNRQLFFNLYGSYADKLRTRYGAYDGWEQLTRALERELRLGLRSPPIKAWYGDPVMRFDVVDQRINAVRYGLNATIGTLGADLSLTRRMKMSLELQGGITELECPLGTDCDRDLDVRRLRGGRPIQQGNLHTLKLGPTFHVEGRDDPISPSRGYFAFARFYQAIGSATGTEANAQPVPFAFLKWEGILSTYVRSFGQVLALSARVGSIVMERSRVPVDERFFLGGRDSLRGFVETTLIPEDACVVESGNAQVSPRCAETLLVEGNNPPLSLGGNTYALIKTELRMPLRDGFSFDIFADIGNLWVNLRRSQGFALRVGTGAGLRYATPVGALSVDLGINPAARGPNREAGWQIHFSIGSF